MEKLQWFKFSISEWKFGKIQRCNPITKSMFLELCCLYWINETKVSIEDAIIECDEEHYKVLVSKKIIKEVNGFIKIYFLDEQFETAIEKSVKARESVEKRWLKRKENETSITYERNTNVLQSNYERNTEENRIEENRKEENRIKKEKEKEKNDIENRKLKFASNLEPFVSFYGRDLINEFYLYWTEPNTSKTKLKFEYQKTWDTKRRLDRWSQNDKNFKTNKNGNTQQPINNEERKRSYIERVLYGNNEPVDSQRSHNGEDNSAFDAVEIVES